jgi:hypothetical protein
MGRSWLVAGAAAVGMMLAGFGVAAAQTDPSTTTSSSATTSTDAQAPGLVAPGTAGQAPNAQKGLGPRGKRGLGKFGLGRGIHGEMTTRAPGGGYQVLATQVGEVKSVSATSLTVQSVDGFSRTYIVDDGTLVNAGNNGIADVHDKDTVRVIAIVKDGKATAVRIGDVTQIKQSTSRWLPGHKA